eukprot:9211254-Heterocapsa_arctica.AAC.1
MLPIRSSASWLSVRPCACMQVCMHSRGPLALYALHVVDRNLGESETPLGAYLLSPRLAGLRPLSGPLTRGTCRPVSGQLLAGLADLCLASLLA